MFGSDPFGSVPFGAGGAEPFDVDAMLASSREELVYTVELTVRNISTNAETTLYLGSAEWATAPTDIPASTPFDGRLQSYSFRRSIRGDRIGGMISGEGSIVFANPDGAYDTYFDGYAVDGRAVVVRVGRIDDPWEDHQVIFRGAVVDWQADLESITVTVRDYGFRLDVPAQPNIYAGTGGKEGGADLINKRKPLAYGHSVSYPLVLVDSSLLIYQAHDGAFDSDSGWVVLDKGLVLSFGADHADYAALAAATVAAGEYDTCEAEGFVRLGSAPDWVPIGDSEFPPPNCPRTDEVIRAICDHATDLTSGEFDAYSFSSNMDVATITFYVGIDDALTVSDCVGRLMLGIGGWGGFSRSGILQLGRFTTPAAPIVATFKRDDGDIISLDRVALPDGLWPPPWRWRVAKLRNWTTTTEFAATVSDTLRARLSQPYQLAVAEDSLILADHPLAKDPDPVEAYYLDDSAATEAARLLSLYDGSRHMYRMTLSRRALQCMVGDVISVTFPRFGLDAGKSLRIVEIEDKIQISDGSEVDQVEIVAFG